MRVTAKEVMAAWVELDRQAPYHTENKPIGTDRKHVEGPMPTNESFPNSWLPTQKAEVCAEPTGVEQIAVTSIEVAAMNRAADREIIPGVPEAMFRAWEQAHDEFFEFYDNHTIEVAERLVHYLVQFANEARRLGLQMRPEDLQRLQNYTATHPPRMGNKYSPDQAEEIINELDLVIQKLHSEAVRLTNTKKTQWYEYQNEQMNKGLEQSRQQWDKMISPTKTPEKRLTPEELLDQRGEMAPFYEDMWKRRRRHELTGMRVTAIDVQRTKKKVKPTPITDRQHDIFDKSKNQPVQETIAPQPEPAPLGDPLTNLELPENENGGIDPSSIRQTIGEIADWNDAADEDMTLEGSIFHYRKRIEFSDDDPENALEFDAFVEPFSIRKKRLIDQANRLDSNTGRGGSIRAQEIRREAEGMPDAGYINDIEVFYRGELFYHRERAFTPQRALTSREFMSGDSLQRATTDLQQYIRTKIDPVSVGEWYRYVMKNPGKGENKLSHRGDVMRITTAEVLPFDPSKRRLKTLPSVRKGPLQAQPQADAYAQEPLEGDDYENLLMLYDSTVQGLDQIAEAFANIQSSLPPEQYREAGMLILKLQSAMRALGA